MKICIIAEGCYPYVIGGVSGWINSLIKAFPQHEFMILAIIADREQSGKFQYELPDNVSGVYEAYLNDVNWVASSKKTKFRMSKEEYTAIRSIVLNYKTDWDVVFNMFKYNDVDINDLLMGEDFYNIAKECYNGDYTQIVFSDFLWTMRSIYLPLFLILNTSVPKADIYHCVATGYAGVLGSMATTRRYSGMVLTEHGIYTREREEELLKAKWVSGIYKNIWIDQFRKLSLLAYDTADIVTALYGHAKELQIELGCRPDKISVVPNGIAVENFEGIPLKEENDQYINVGAVLRVAPIKDVKTMIRAFAFAKEEVPNLKLWIMGPVDEDEQYADECRELVRVLKVEDIVFTGRINTREYIGKMDFTILTSISEGQPLTILESYAAKKPVIATNVGNCKELIYGDEGDDFGQAGILAHIMNTEEIAKAMVLLARDNKLRREMGEIGYKRVNEFYRIDLMRDRYKDIYKRAYKGIEE